MDKDHPIHSGHHHSGHNSYEVTTLLAWSAPGRPYKKRTKNYFASILLIALFIEIILFLFSQYALIFVVLSLVFVSFAFSSVPPQSFHYRISTEGVTVQDSFFLWKELYDFYFKKRNGADILHIRTNDFPGEITMMLGELPVDEVREKILPYLPFREYVKPTFTEKSADWISKNFPLEKE